MRTPSAGPPRRRRPGAEWWLRFLLALAGIGLVGYGILRLAQAENESKLIAIGSWLIGALVVHDGVISPLVIAAGLVISALVPRPWQRFVLPALVSIALVSSVAVILIWREGTSTAASLALLQRNYFRSLLILIGVIMIGTAAAAGYATIARVKRTNSRPRQDH